MRTESAAPAELNLSYAVVCVAGRKTIEIKLNYKDNVSVNEKMNVYIGSSADLEPVISRIRSRPNIICISPS